MSEQSRSNSPVAQSRLQGRRRGRYLVLAAVLSGVAGSLAVACDETGPSEIGVHSVPEAGAGTGTKADTGAADGSSGDSAVTDASGGDGGGASGDSGRVVADSGADAADGDAAIVPPVVN